ncbi:tryptophanase leader peptide [Moellerella wisconsensis]
MFSSYNVFMVLIGFFRLKKWFNIDIDLVFFFPQR